ncbi:uncharacterized protein LOC120135691 [Hibiscus syriacus]|uniref:uncharacterized protein LOC120135691 n=1 Tax=Hibiscus syriacus TaxID=106335 RepID=UPI0019239F8E|nr:uncharacterized protein LOC120135691 [Hibiscus syriacus]
MCPEEFESYDNGEGCDLPSELLKMVEKEDKKILPYKEPIEILNLGFDVDKNDVKIGTTLSDKGLQNLIKLLQEYKDVFSWSYKDMPGLDTELVVHKLPIRPECKPLQQKLRIMKPKILLKVKEEVKKKFDARFLKVAKYPEWVANIAPATKKDGGDFNVILQQKEISDYELMGPSLTSDMKDFQDFTQYLHLQDYPFFGLSFTWSYKQQHTFLAKKLDRVLINPTWVNTFYNSFVEFLAPGASDHCMALVWISRETQVDRPKPFKIFNLWTLHPNFLNEVQQSWQSPIKGNSMKAKVQWLKEGDKYTKFFHSFILGKHKRDTIRILVDDQGRRLESFDEMASEVTDFYSGLLGSMDPRVKRLKNQFSTRAMTKLQALMDSLQSFSKKSWSVVGDDVVKAIKYFFQETFILPTFNATTIALVPKVPNPNNVRDFRPISCCSVIYKTITKILVKRLATLLPGIISLNQSTFVKGRNIVDNTLLAQELVRGYGRKSISPRCALKIDLQKVFDSLRWGFISSILKALQLPNSFIGWIETYYSEARYSISFNRSLIVFFKGARGIRQGDPLSPILFVLAMNVLSRILNMVAAKGLFGYHPKCKKIGLTHLSFADDLLIFCKGNIEYVGGVISVLDQFYEIYGLKLNAAKCELYTSGISIRNLDHSLHSTGFKHG